MSVVKAKRHLSPHEFWWQMEKLKEYTALKISNTPKRKRKIICVAIGKHTADAWHYTALADEIRIKDEETRIMRTELFAKAIHELEELQKPLYIYWNIQHADTKSMEFWSNSINEEMTRIAGIYEKESGKQMHFHYIKILHWKQMRECQYVSKMAEYHKYVHGKLMHLPYDCMDVQKYREIIDHVFCEIVQSNWKIPETKQEFKKRKELIEDAIKQLNASQYLIYSIWNLKPFSEREMNEWAGMLNEILKLLSAVRKSDASRFCSLT